MSHNSVESMRDLAFRKGRNAFRNEREYREALAGGLDDADGSALVGQVLDLLADRTAADVRKVHEWVEKVVDARNGSDLPGVLELPGPGSGESPYARPMRFRAVNASTAVVEDLDENDAYSVDSLDLSEGVRDLLDGGLADEESRDDEEDEGGDEEESESSSVELLEKALSYNTVEVPVMTRGGFIGRLRDWIAQGGGQTSLMFACGPGETVALTKPEGRPALTLRHCSRWFEKTIVECYAMSDADLLDFIDRHE